MAVTPDLEAFAELAEAYCQRLLGAEREALVEDLHRLLARLYAAALELPETGAALYEGAEEEGAAALNSPSEELGTALKELAQELAGRRHYWELFDPYEGVSEGQAAEPVLGDLVDDLGDVFRDLNRGLDYWRRGRELEALWEWRFHFEAHWGEHATSALRALYALSAWSQAE